MTGFVRNSKSSEPDGSTTRSLAYATPPARARLQWRHVLGFLAAASAVAVAYWWNADWWAYVHPGGGAKPWPKFEMPLWWQAIESAVVGIAGGAAAAGLWWTVRRFRRG